MSLFIVSMDATVVNVALPSIGRELHSTISGLQWTIDAYTLVLASLLMLSGSTADRIGRRRTFQIGLTLFSIGSLLCSIAPSVGWWYGLRLRGRRATPWAAHEAANPGSRRVSSSSRRASSSSFGWRAAPMRMIAVHELAHLKEKEHDKAFYKLCCWMEPHYHQLEFDLRLYLTWLDLGGRRLWSATAEPVAIEQQELSD